MRPAGGVCRADGVLVCGPAELCQSASCGEVFLLASAALANITFFDSMACEILLQLNAIQILLQACRDRQRVDTPYSKDQVLGWSLQASGADF